MSINKIKLVFFFFILVAIAAIEIAFSPPQTSTITIEGTAIYDDRTFRDQRVKVMITEDGEHYKTLNASSKGVFQTKVDFNHQYIFHLSMDYHATSKILVDTRVPENIAANSAGGFFEFKCQVFEMYEGLNTAILRKPIMRMRYIEEKDKFEFDKEYTESLRFNLDGFAARIDELKKRRKKPVKNEKEATAALAKAEPTQKKERKVIEFESEKEKPKAINKRGHRNIMDIGNEEESVVEVEEVFEDEVKEGQTIAEVENPELSEVEDLYLDEELDESEFTSLNVIPTRISITGLIKAKQAKTKEIDLGKTLAHQTQEKTRLKEEAKIREEVNSYNKQVFVQKEMRMTNKKIQTSRLRILIKTIALAEIYYKKEYYAKYPINHTMIIPSVVVHTEESWWVDEEKVMIRYPNSSETFRKETLLFGVTNYFRGDKKINESAYCSSIAELSQNQYECAN